MGSNTRTIYVARSNEKYKRYNIIKLKKWPKIKSVEFTGVSDKGELLLFRNKGKQYVNLSREKK